MNGGPGDTESAAFARLLSHDVASLVRAARQLSGFAREDVLRGDVDAAMQALGLLDVRLAGIDRFVAEFLRYRNAAQRVPEITQFAAGALIDDAFRRAAAPCGARLARCGANPTVVADRSLAAGVLHEVMHNAVIHHPEPGTLSVEVAMVCAADDRLEIVVQDNGRGIPDAAHERVFEPFVKLSGESQRCGLGLAWCRRALRAAGGYIALRPVARGACVVIGLPLGEAASIDAAATRVPERRQPRLRIV